MEQIILEALARALAVGTPLLLACLGAILNERGGVVNLGVEGLMAVGALAAFAVAYPQGNLWLAVGRPCSRARPWRPCMPSPP